jgi:hypothetical protein
MASATILEIERAIGTLSSHELKELDQWLAEYCPSPLDARIPSDLAACRLDSVIGRALHQEADGQVRSL